MPILRGSLMIKEGGGVLIHLFPNRRRKSSYFAIQYLCVNNKISYSIANPIVYSTGGARNNLSNVYLFSN